MRVRRAHSYADVQAARAWYEYLPAPWRASLEAFGLEWVIMPPGSDPLWYGIIAADPRTDPFYRTVAGYCHRDGERPYVYLNAAYPSAAIHEALHYFDYVLWWCAGVDVEQFFRPGTSVTPYGETNATEYWPEMTDAWLYVEQQAEPNEATVRRLNPPLFEFLWALLDLDVARENPLLRGRVV